MDMSETRPQGPQQQALGLLSAPKELRCIHVFLYQGNSDAVAVPLDNVRDYQVLETTAFTIFRPQTAAELEVHFHLHHPAPCSRATLIDPTSWNSGTYFNTKFIYAHFIRIYQAVPAVQAVTIQATRGPAQPSARPPNTTERGSVSLLGAAPGTNISQQGGGATHPGAQNRNNPASSKNITERPGTVSGEVSADKNSDALLSSAAPTLDTLRQDVTRPSMRDDSNVETTMKGHSSAPPDARHAQHTEKRSRDQIGEEDDSYLSDASHISAKKKTRIGPQPSRLGRQSIIPVARSKPPHPGHSAPVNVSEATQRAPANNASTNTNTNTNPLPPTEKVKIKFVTVLETEHLPGDWLHEYTREFPINLTYDEFSTKMEQQVKKQRDNGSWSAKDAEDHHDDVKWEVLFISGPRWGRMAPGTCLRDHLPVPDAGTRGRRELRAQVKIRLEKSGDAIGDFDRFKRDGGAGDGWDRSTERLLRQREPVGYAELDGQ